MEEKRAETPRDIMESQEYAFERKKVLREINQVDWARERWLPDYKEFEKSPEERDHLATMKIAWRQKIQRKGWSKRHIPNAYISKSLKFE